MLAQFTVENFLSFKDEVVFSMLATEDLNHRNHVVSTNSGKRLLRVAAIYGANASGKSNLVKAIEFVKNLIVNGRRGDDKIPIRRFRLSATNSRQPSRFQFVILHQGQLYSYGLACNEKYILEEWLSLLDMKEKKFFERTTSAKGVVKVKLGAALLENTDENFLQFVAKGTRPNQPFLTEAIERNVEQVKPIMKWFVNTLTVVSAESNIQSLEFVVHKDRSFAEYMTDFLRNAGTGIDGVVTKEVRLDYDRYFPDMPESVRHEIRTEVSALEATSALFVVAANGRQFVITKGENQPKLIILHTQHRMDKGDLEDFDIYDESDGTQRLMHLIPAFYVLNSQPKVFVIDELDRRLHTKLTALLLRKFLQDQSAEHRGQLVFTTHDTNLLDSGLLRDDEIWFVEKDDVGASRCYPLAEFTMQENLDIHKGYLSGRFGGVPVIRDFAS